MGILHTLKINMATLTIIWRDEHFKGKSFRDIAKDNNCSRAYVLRLVGESFTF